jgi:hypothetical protein
MLTKLKLIYIWQCVNSYNGTPRLDSSPQTSGLKAAVMTTVPRRRLPELKLKLYFTLIVAKTDTFIP